VLAGCLVLAAGAVVGASAPGSGRTVYGDSVTVVGYPGADRGLLRDLAARADRAARTVTGLFGAFPRPLVIVPDTTAQGAALAGTGSVDGMAALASGDRVIVLPGAFSRLTPTGRDVVLAHELTHVATGDARAPLWLREGMADYVGYRNSGLDVLVAAAELAAEVRAGRSPQELPGPGSFAPGGVRLAAVYQEAWLACRLIARLHGERALVRLYREVGERGISTALSTLGLSRQRLTLLWREDVRRELA